MFDLFASHYDAVSKSRFFNDLSDKHYALVLMDANSHLAGFTLVKFIEIVSPVRCMAAYSGDTIVSPEWWGRHDLVQAFFRLAGAVKASKSDLPLFWTTIFNGYRTWRILPACCNTYWPHPDEAMPPQVRSLKDHLGHNWFGDAFDPETGLVRFTQSIGHLKPDIASIPAHLLDHPEIQFFAASNPGYLEGDELFCLAELSECNLRGLGKRAFLEGVRQPPTRTIPP